MPDRTLPNRLSLEQYKKQAKEPVRDTVAGVPAALVRMPRHHPFAAGQPRLIALADAQFVLAREHG